MTLLLYADDLLILAELPEELQRALCAVAAWGRIWRFSFAGGPDKSAVLCFRPPRVMPAPLRLGHVLLPFVSHYRYLGVVFDARRSWLPHIAHVLARGERLMGQCLHWTVQHHLPLAFSLRLLSLFVLPSVLYGLEFVDRSSALRRVSVRLRMWLRRLLRWPAGAPIAAVHGDTGVPSLPALILPRAATLLGRLVCISPGRPRRSIAAAVLGWARRNRSSWTACWLQHLSELGLPPLGLSGLAPGAPPSLVAQWRRHVVCPRAVGLACQDFQHASSSTHSLNFYQSC